MIIEEGKQYVTRRGDVTGKLKRTSDFSLPWSGFVGDFGHRWHPDGTWCRGVESGLDIVSEYALGHKDVENTANRDEALSELVAEGQRLGMYDVASTVDATGIGAPKPEPVVRQFATGATRNADTNKLDYEGFNCPMAQRAFAEYMHGHRKQADGTIRDSANWQKGMGLDVYAKSLIRHVHDFHCLHRGWEITRPEDGKPMPPDDEHKLELLCAIWFNVQGYIHETLKAQKKCDTSSAG